MTVLVIFDQASKYWADSELNGKGIISVIGDFVILHFTQNRGAFLSLGNSLGEIFWFPAFVILPILFIAAFSFYIIWKKLDKIWFVILWILIASGAVGNLIDRIFHGQVIDFMNIGIGGLRSGIFNVADLYIVGAFFMLVFAAFGKKK